MTVPGTRIKKKWKMQKGRWGWETTNTGCENPAATRDGANPAADRFLISEPAAFHVEFSVWFRYEDIISGRFWELSQPSACAEKLAPAPFIV